MKPLNASTLDRFLKLALKSLKGEWVLLGGSLLPALKIDYRQTVDIDLSPLDPATNANTIQLMELAEKLGLPVETINPAAGFFLFKIDDYNNRLMILMKNKTCTLYRPALDLYLELKLNRASPSDITDCEQLIDYCKKNKLTEEIKKAKNFLDPRGQRALLKRLMD